MIKSQTFTGTPGLWYLNTPVLMGVTLLGVWREGTALKKIDPIYTPSGAEFYFISTGQLQFDPNIPFFGTLANDIRETVFCIWDE